MQLGSIENNKTRKAMIFNLRDGALRKYRERHSHLPEEMKSVLTNAGISNYTIWNYGLSLFAYFEVENEDRMQHVLNDSIIYAQWRKEMEEFLQIDNSGNKEWPMEMVFLHE